MITLKPFVVLLLLLLSAANQVDAQVQVPSDPCRQTLVKGWVAELPEGSLTCPISGPAWSRRSFKLDEQRTLCSYEWRLSSSPTTAGLPAGLSYQADCMAVGVSTKEASFQSQPEGATGGNLANIEAAFLAALDAPRVPTPLRTPIAKELPTLAFIDALPVPASVPQLGAIQHGNSLATLAELLGGCDRSPCRFRFGWYGEPALFPFAGGQVVGSPLDTTQAIDGALASFQQSESEHLVLSIGLGFEADAECSALPNSPVVSALRESIRRAACGSDAIVIAPVGNIRDDDATTGMLYPAAFQHEELVCDGVAQGRPLVAAISGVNVAQLHPLSSSRADAPLMTIGGPWAHAGPAAERLNPRAASSVAVAAAGPLISLAWWLRPDLDAKRLLTSLQRAGSESHPSVKGSKVVTVCAALEALCNTEQPGRCSQLRSLCPARVQAPQLVELRAPQPAAAPEQAWSSGPVSCVGRGQRLDPSGPGE